MGVANQSELPPRAGVVGAGGNPARAGFSCLIDSADQVIEAECDCSQSTECHGSSGLKRMSGPAATDFRQQKRGQITGSPSSGLKRMSGPAASDFRQQKRGRKRGHLPQCKTVGSRATECHGSQRLEGDVRSGKNGNPLQNPLQSASEGVLKVSSS